MIYPGGIAIIKANKVGTDTTLAQIIKLENAKALIQKLADKISIFVFIIWISLCRK